MRLGLKEVMAVAALATAGCTSPTPEDAKDEVHPVCAVSDTHSDTINEETVATVRKRCYDDAVKIAILSIPLMKPATQEVLAEFEQERDKNEAKCLTINGLNE